MPYALHSTLTTEYVDAGLGNIQYANIDEIEFEFEATNPSSRLHIFRRANNSTAVWIEYTVTDATLRFNNGGTSAPFTLTDGARYTFRIVKTAPALADLYINGSLIDTGIALPTGNFFDKMFESQADYDKKLYRLVIRNLGVDLHNYDPSLSNGTGSILTNTVGADGTLVNYPTDGSQWFFYSNNQVPIANAGVDQNVDTGIPVQLDGSGSSDPELATLTYLWTLSVPVGSSATLSDANIVNPTFTPDIDGTYTATLVVNDGTQDSAPNDAVITATTVPNVAPTANAGTDQVNVVAGSTVTLDGTSSTDSDGTIASFAWTQTAGDSVVLNTTNPAQPTFTAPSTASPQTLTFSLVVTDNDGASSIADTVNIGVSAQQSVLATPDETGLRLTNANASYITIPSYTFPASGIVTITSRFYLETENINRSIFVLRNAPFEVSFSISQLGVGSFYVATDTNAQSLQAGNFTHDNYYVVVLTLDMVSGAMTADVNGATFADTIGTDVQSLQGVTTGTGFNSAIGSAFGATFLEGVFYQLNINATDNYSTNDSNTSVGEVVDTLGGASGVIQSYEANQWVNLVTPIGDITPPVITLNGSANVVVQQGDTYADAGATALDNVDGDITANIVTVNPVDTATLGTYTITYNVADSAGNNATEVTRTVVVEAAADTTPPVITVTPGNQTITVGDAAPTFTATATDDTDGDITADIVETGDTIDNSTVGVYTRRWNVSDSAGNAAVEVTRTVTVQAQVDTTPPVITISPTQTVYNITVGDSFTIPTGTATDDVDGVSSITPTGTVDTSTAGTYTLTYSATDSAGNVATPVVVTVNVAEAPQTSNELQTSEFSLVTDNILMSFKDRSNIEVMQFKVPNAIANELGLFDFTASNVTKVEVTTAINSTSGSTIDSDGDAVSFEDDKLFVELGTLTGIGVQSIAVIIYTAEDSKGLVICGPGLNNSNAVVTFIN